MVSRDALKRRDEETQERVGDETNGCVGDTNGVDDHGSG